MFAYGICIGTESKYAQFASVGLSEHAAGSVLLERRDQNSIFKAYNSMIDETRTMQDVEGLVLLHEDVELREGVEGTLRREFADPDVAIVGVIGGRGIRSVRWVRSAETFGHAPDSFYGENDHGRGNFDVDTVDGLFLALSPWALENLRFDTDTFTGFHAYDADICRQARAAQKKVRVVDIDLFHHTKGGFGDPAKHRKVDEIFRRKWGIPRDSVAHRFKQRLKKLPY